MNKCPSPTLSFRIDRVTYIMKHIIPPLVGFDGDYTENNLYDKRTPWMILFITYSPESESYTRCHHSVIDSESDPTESESRRRAGARVSPFPRQRVRHGEPS